MDEILNSVLSMSAMGSILALVLLCIKPLTKRLFSPRWQYYIWLTVLIVMVLPIKVSLPAEPLYVMPTKNTAVQTEQIAPAEVQQGQTQPAALEELSQGPALRTPDIPSTVVRLSVLLWLAAAVLLPGYKLVKYIMFLRTIKKYSVTECSLENIPKRLTVRKTELLDAPLIVGLIKPVLYLPQAEIKEDELDYILLHELTHYRRHDLLYKWFAMLVSSIHWFNPLVYIVSKQIDEECEVSCDYEVCKSLTEQQKKDYMTMILGFVQNAIRKRRPLTTQMASSKKILKRRFMMMKTKKTTGKFVSALSVVLAIAMLSTTVFASGVLSGLTDDTYTVEITNNGEVIELVNKPFIENGEVYVPLRETFEKVSYNETNSHITWNNGTIDVTVLNNAGDTGTCRLKIGEGNITFRRFQGENTYAASEETNDEIIFSGDNVPILKNNLTYIPYSWFDFLSYAFNADNLDISYMVYDKNGNMVDFNGFYHVVLEEYSIKIPDSWTGKYTVLSTDDKVTFLQTATYEKYGEGSGALFTIEKASPDYAEELLNSLGGSKLLYSNDEYSYIFEVPTDVQYPIWVDRDEEDVEIAAEYENMFAYIDFIANSFTLSDAS